jgi:hypothetical protein
MNLGWTFIWLNIIWTCTRFLPFSIIILARIVFSLCKHPLCIPVKDIFRKNLLTMVHLLGRKCGDHTHTFICILPQKSQKFKRTESCPGGHGYECRYTRIRFVGIRIRFSTLCSKKPKYQKAGSVYTATRIWHLAHLNPCEWHSHSFICTCRKKAKNPEGRIRV